MFFSLSLLWKGYSQEIRDDISPVMPPSPTASELGKYGTASVSLSDGASSLSIPLYEFKTSKLTLPISLNYNSNGVKVDQIASRVGMGWMLSAGGVISRTVYGNSDESATWMNAPASPMTNEEWVTFLDNAAHQGFETQPDIYTVSFAGHSGKFYIKNQSIIKLEENNLKITGAPESGFNVVTPDGITYEFMAAESSVSINNQLRGLFDRTPIPNAWFLTRIIHPDGEQIELQYGNCDFSYTSAILHSVKKLRSATYPDNLPSCASCPQVPNILSESIIRLRNYGVYPVSITGSGYGRVEFSYEPREDVPGDVRLSSMTISDPPAGNAELKTYFFSYIYSNAGSFTNSHSSGNTQRLFLKEVKECSDQAGQHVKGRYRCSYHDINGLPPRLSYAKDDYGYFNGKNNSILIPAPPSGASSWPYAFADRSCNSTYGRKGLLTKLSYPTGGSDSVEYEPNSVYVSNPGCGTSKSLIGAAGESEFKVISTYETPEFDIECSQTISIKVANTVLFGGYGQQYYGTSICVMKQGEACQSYASGTTTSMYAGMGELKFFNFTFSPGRYKIIMDVKGPSLGNAELEYFKKDLPGLKEVSGLRVSRIIRENLATPSEVIRYYYNGGQLANDFITYQSVSVTKNRCVEGNAECSATCEYDSFSSSFSYDLGAYSGNHIYYSQVTEGFGENMENGGIEHTFKMGNDGPPAIVLGLPFPGCALSNFGIGRGAETKTRYFRRAEGADIDVKEVSYYYNTGTALSNENVFYAVRASEAFPSFCFGGRTMYDLRGWDLSEYRLFTRWQRLDSITEKTYDRNGANPQVQKTFYTYNPAHQLAVSTLIKDSNGQEVVISRKYPQDVQLSGPEETARLGLISRWMIDKPLEESRTKAGTLIRTSRSYRTDPVSNLVLPFKVQSNTSATGGDELRMEYKEFDAKGNLLSVQMEDSKEVCYVWGYGGQFPVAKIENAAYAAVRSVLGGEQAISDFRDNMTVSDSQVSSFLAPLRTDPGLKGAIVTTYTYDPLKGISSMTDAKGQVTYYQYDDFQRLWRIMDQNGKVLKEYNYHYKQ